MSSNPFIQSQPTKTNGENAIGAAEMLQLHREFPSKGVCELIQMFGEEGALIMQRLATAAEHEDGEALRRAAHALRGAGANFGAQTLDALCQEIEVSARAADFSTAIGLLAQVRQEYLRVEIALQKECPPPVHE